MDDLISRQALMKEFADFVKRSNNSDFAPTPTWNDAVSLVGSMPSANAVGVVRCRECKHLDTHNHRCKVWNHGVYVWFDFCGRAERRDDGQN